MERRGPLSHADKLKTKQVTVEARWAEQAKERAKHKHPRYEPMYIVERGAA